MSNRQNHTGRDRPGRRRAMGWAPLALAAAAVLASCAPSGVEQQPGGRPSIPPKAAQPTTTLPVADPGPAEPPVVLPPATNGPPAISGVSYVDVDGGPEYFGRWANSFPTDASFFPIGVWAETLAETRMIDRYQALGINTFTNLWNGPQESVLSQLRQRGMYAVASPAENAFGASFNSNVGNTLAGFYYQDEGDGHSVCGYQESWLRPLCSVRRDSRTSEVSLQNMADAIRGRDSSRPVYGQFTKPVALDGQGLTDRERRAYVAAADIVSFDYYVLTDVWNPANVWDQATAVRRVRELSDHAKPVWPFIETSHVFEEATYRPTAADVNAEVWNAIIGGARGIQYFNHDFSPGNESQRVLLDSRFADIAAQVKSTNRRITTLAPVLNAPYAEGLATVTGGAANVMAKGYDGSVYLFVAPTTRASQSVTLALQGIGDATATVVDENRTVPVTGGVLTDQFADQNTIHIYKITPAA